MNLQLFQKFIPLPFLLALVSFLFPLFTLSCSEKTIIEPNAYELAMGLDLNKHFNEEEQKIALAINQKAESSLLQNDTKLIAYPVFYGLFAAILLAALFALLSPIGSLALGVASLITLWFILYKQITHIHQIATGVLQIKPHIGAYSVSFFLIMGIAMSIAFLIRYTPPLKAKK
ncbi:MAG: hypothetical protein GX116_02585 [Fibrobacter sp.]|nr:hypothetical protein [Fibrobacter sp.]